MNGNGAEGGGSADRWEAILNEARAGDLGDTASNSEVAGAEGQVEGDEPGARFEAVLDELRQVVRESRTDEEVGRDALEEVAGKVTTEEEKAVAQRFGRRDLRGPLAAAGRARRRQRGLENKADAALDVLRNAGLA